MGETAQLFQAFVAPAIFVSAAALLALSLNVRLMGMVTRLRNFQRQQYLAACAERRQEAEAYADQISSIEERADKIRRAFLFTLLCLAGAILACLLLGLGHYWPQVQVLAVLVFVAAILCLLVGTVFYIAEMAVALSSVRDEAKYLRFMNLGAPAGGEGPSASERRQDWQRAG